MFIVIPQHVLKDRRLSYGAMLLYGSICTYESETLFKTNNVNTTFLYKDIKHLEDVFKVKKRTMHRWLANLIECDYITYENVELPGLMQRNYTVSSAALFDFEEQES